ncbi:hypothetical protein BKA69DRAFT_1097450 [Paraphysoderma sedebokerense]|nr:hypothetical protein BKA69DRAFT_1097450 [Paraphysoderma sedebokerense]
MSGKPTKYVFVGNIPYDATEEQLLEIFREVGPVASFRLVFDKETGRPRGYGFCEYFDVETASSAVRNLVDYEVNGRNLRIDFAESDPGKHMDKGDRGGRGGDRDRDRDMDDMRSRGSASNMSLNVSQNSGQSAQDAISSALASMTPDAIYDLLSQMKTLVHTNPDQARLLMVQNPQLAYAFFQAMLMLNLVAPTVLQRILTSQAQSQIPPKPPVPQVPQIPQMPQPPAMPFDAGMAMMQNMAGSQAMNPFLQQQQQQAAMMAGMGMGMPNPAAMNVLQEQQKNLLLQVINLTPQQIEMLPPDQRAQVLQLKAQAQMLMGGGT